MTRSLATIRTIINLKPIKKADLIEVAVIDGWEVIVKKGEFKPGDLCVYFEIDSFLPIEERYEFLRSSSFKRMNGVEGFRLRTIKMRGQISQGLALPVSAFPSPMAGRGEDGKDVTEFLKIQKWEAPEKGMRVPGMSAANSRGFPSWIRKTDQERIQNCFDKVTALSDGFEVTLKLDGSSMSVYHRDGRLGVCSRNVDLTERRRNVFWQTVRGAGALLRLSDDKLDRLELKCADLWASVFKRKMPGLVIQQDRYWKTARKLKLLEALKASGLNVALQGELMGPGIQGNREGFTEHEFFLFDIWDIDNQRYYGAYERANFVDDYLSDFADIKVAPQLNYLLISNFNSVQSFLDFAKKPSINHPVAEGFVFKSLDGRHSFKVINNDFLLQETDEVELENAA